MLAGKIVALGRMEELRKQARVDGKLEEVFFKITEAARPTGGGEA
jgi:hypothetical protein